MAPSDTELICVNAPFHLKIQQGGPFFQDLWFEPHRDHFIAAVRYLLTKWGEKIDQVQEMDIVHLYRKICHKHMKEDATVFTHTEEHSHQKIVFNVDNLLIQDMHVSSNGNCELLVHGNSEETEAGIIPKNFRHKFPLSSDTLLMKADIRLSSDGILTIIIPYEKHRNQKRVSSPKKNKENINNDIQQNVTNSSSLQVKGNRNSLEIIPEFDCALINKNKQSSKLQERKAKVVKPHSSPIKKGKCLPVIKRGKFFNDPIFQDSHNFFNEAVKEVLTKYNINKDGNKEDNLEKYRKLRENDLREGTQAIITLENDKMQKIIIDVWDFLANGQIKLKDVDDKHLLVKGRLQKKEGGIDTIKCFKKAFLLPHNSSLQRTSFDMSSDGILIITSSRC
ncbi:unnamed protein product [Meganyctiphanes norvegica]|uniref:SHSP domain-containing protein n=1 Tax=Meganyctiphanes norvegica TaxID=48144 RepID=A0AAV2SFA0_MEGNR